MRCPYCHFSDSRVLDSRPADEGASIRRRRECLACGRRFTTYEKIESDSFLVVKKDGRREPFFRDKCLAGMRKACEKRPIPLSTLEEAVAEIERELWGTGEREISSRAVGELVMEKLRRIDQVAYVRFASVYREFKDLSSFRKELDSLIGSSKTSGEG